MSPALLPTVQVRERSLRRTPFGLRVRDLATGRDRIDGLLIDVAPSARHRRRTRAIANPSGIYCAHDLPGLATFERTPDDDPAVWNAPPRTYRVLVRDPADRFLPVTFEAALPNAGLLDPWPIDSPLSVVMPAPMPAPESPLAESPPMLPLFSSPSRPVPDVLAALHAELREHPSGRPAAWALLQLTIGGVVRGLGLADRQGRVAVIFPYPPSPRAALTSPASPRDDFLWDLSLTAYYRPPSVDRPVSEVPDLADLTAQLDQPRQPLGGLTPPLPLGPLALDYRVPAIARTRLDAAEESPYLFINMT